MLSSPLVPTRYTIQDIYELAVNIYCCDSAHLVC